MLGEHVNAHLEPASFENPSVDEVLTEVASRIKASCSPIAIDTDALDDWFETYRPPFERRLSVARWNAEKANVLRAAEQHGLIAKALATLLGQNHVDVDTFRRASRLVTEHCRKRFAQGIWCS